MKKTLVCVAYHETPQTYMNMLYFLHYGIVSLDRNEYIIVVNGESSVVFPSTVRVIYRPNRGFDFGAHKGALDILGDAIWETFDFFVFMNASVIGPIQMDDHQDWVDRFRHEFTQSGAPDVALLGTTIVCLPHWDVGGEGPRVEGFFWCTDCRGLSLLLEEKTILCDHPSKYSAIVHGEYGLSRCILRHNLNLACMLRRYRGLDWRDRTNWHHNDCRHPSRDGSYYGSSIDPYEVIFHKWYWKELPTVNLHIIKTHIHTKIRTDIETNTGQPFHHSFCPQSYLRLYPDLGENGIKTDESATDHFLSYGYFERRHSRSPEN